MRIQSIFSRNIAFPYANVCYFHREEKARLERISLMIDEDIPSVYTKYVASGRALY